MKILWLSNVLPAYLSQKMGLSGAVSGSWLSAQFKELHLLPEISLSIAVPSADARKVQISHIEGVQIYLFPVCERDLLTNLGQILRMALPDIVHIHGTELAQSLYMLEAFPPKKTLVSIQGLVSECAKVYNLGLPPKYDNASMLKKIFRRLNLTDSAIITLEKKEMQLAGQREITSIKKSENVAGRTAWDKKHTKLINPSISYCHIGEILRPSFYQDRWKREKCKNHRIFISQATYPLKGFHQVLKALPPLIEKYPDLHVIVAGYIPYKKRGFVFDAISDYLFEYPAYLKRIIKETNLQDHITFTGPLDEENVKKEMLLSEIFLLASNIENSPNSLGEAMLLGLPCAATNVGGIPSMLTHTQEGILFSENKPLCLQEAVVQLFENPKQANLMGENAHLKAMVTHDPKKITKQLMDCYKSLYAEL